MTVSPITSESHKPISSSQKKSMRTFMTGAVDKAVVQLGLTRQGYENLRGHPDLQSRLIELIRDCSGSDPRYQFLANLGEIVVLEDFDHDTYLDTFGAAHKGDFYYYNEALTSANFTKATTRLMPGRRLQVDAYRIKTRVTSVDNLAFLASQGSVLTGAQGAGLVWQQKRAQLPKGYWYASFDEKEALWKDADGSHRVPGVYAGSGGDFSFDLGGFGDDWGGESVLLVFRDVPLDA